jgi:hypothetical protein
MKTNHQRNFKAKKDDGRLIRKLMFGWSNKTEVGDPHWVAAKYPGLDHSQGHRGAAHAVKGAKKFVRSRTRAREDRELQKIAKEVIQELINGKSLDEQLEELKNGNP